ncbi:MAG: molybdate ABC transporter substrate-binding protein [Rhodocyclaceae bacterium]|nr:molybdate ABC transporter substrate-binding protein [Rhodocyclaceae bacterium]
MRTILTFLCCLASFPAARADEVLVAVAANFAAPMKEIAESFARATGHRALLAFGSTGRLYAQIRNGAPFAVLLAADRETPERLERFGLTVPGTRRTYAIGRLALWSPVAGQVDEAGQVLKTGNVGRLAIANPKLAPYGRAAAQTLQALGLWQSLRPRLVTAESIAQSHQFVASGNVPLGFVALSQVVRGGRLLSGSAWQVPERLHQPLRQDLAVLRPGEHSPAAAALLRYLASAEARRVITDYGYRFVP